MRLDRKRRFLVGFLFVCFVFALPLVSVIVTGLVWGVVVVLAGFLGSVYFLYRFTIGRVKPKYPLVPPEGKPDVYTGVAVPRPVYEDVEQHPWFFKKKKKRKK